MQGRYQPLVVSQRNFFSSGQTLSSSFRLTQLKKLKTLIHLHHDEIIEALRKDLHKSEMEAALSEVFLVLEELDLAIKKTKKWIKPKKVSTPFHLWPGRSYLHSVPYGCVLIIAPWNYPFLLLISPLVGAMSAGNCIVLKPSELAMHTEKLIHHLINSYFPPHYITTIMGDGACVNELIKEKWDYIFFTGGTQIGRKIMSAAAQQLTPVTLELGGKSPCIVDQTADLQYAAKRIIWAKMLNAGQSCVAPDYVFVHHSCKSHLLEKLQETIREFYGKHPIDSNSYARIINEKHFLRLKNLLSQGRIIYGGEVKKEENFISPTLLDQVSWEDEIMQEEIFGPILPILSFDRLEEIIDKLKMQAKPLALYLFTKSKSNELKIISQLSFGGMCVNDCVMHLANLNLPFGGVGESGLGQYHGYYSFNTFSRLCSIYQKKLLIDLPLAYPPHTKKKLKYVKMLLMPWRFLCDFFK